MQVAIFALALFSIGLSAIAITRHQPLNWRFAVPEIPAMQVAPSFERIFDYRAPTGQAHAPGIVIAGDGFSLVWFEGSEEAQADVDIHATHFTPTEQGWNISDPAPYATRAGLGGAFTPRQLVVTLGNTIQNEAAPDALYATVVSVGGWAMASVADVRMGSDGPVSARKLNLSPLLGRSHLVKSPMVEYADGSYALPAYFEMGSAYSLLARLDAEGRVVDSRRMPAKTVKAIQPMIVPLDASRAVAFLRDFDPSWKLWISRTEDGGQSWSEVEATDVPNSSAPVAALSLGGDRILAVMNDDAERRHELRLSVSEDAGATWRMIHRLEDDAGDARYPMLRRLGSGDILLTFSHSTKRGIRAYLLNDAWVAAQ
ncbi:exo-alpha-sialidase [uncultured Roseovarius sp.]|uniref:exo-alpha-sialidase n=1 Tax=uncultured Roseovarius sp. TaxID=293344 RepID=UPI00263182C3|nr:exo-alpha-sialidase [uncultured Roseovarius sp.]